jgi:hypothetical protein
LDFAIRDGLQIAPEYRGRDIVHPRLAFADPQLDSTHIEPLSDRQYFLQESKQRTIAVAGREPEFLIVEPLDRT